MKRVKSSILLFWTLLAFLNADEEPEPVGSLKGYSRLDPAVQPLDKLDEKSEKPILVLYHVLKEN